MIQLEERDGVVRLPVRAQPRASRTELVGEHGGALKVRLAAPPVDGAANTELLEFLAKQLGVSKSSLRVVAGATGRSKTVEITGLGADDVRRRLELP